jgi:hypothetical protein
VILAAVPAAFQYGLWDSNAHERCRRLELLLVTELTPEDYWRAAGAAAWRRGRGYFAVSMFLWSAGVIAGKLGVLAAFGSLAAAVILWGFYFALGFWGFSRGQQANSLGLVLTIGLPAVALGMHHLGWPQLAALLPPAGVHEAAAGSPVFFWLPGIMMAGGATIVLARLARQQCDRELRVWFSRHHGRKAQD